MSISGKNGKEEEEVYFKYLSFIRKGIIKKREGDIVVVKSIETFKTIYLFEKNEGISDGKIGGYETYDHKEFKRILNCLAEGKTNCSRI